MLSNNSLYDFTFPSKIIDSYCFILEDNDNSGNGSRAILRPFPVYEHPLNKTTFLFILYLFKQSKIKSNAFT